jgi:O-antigen/teichoic acid export membrane protein
MKGTLFFASAMMAERIISFFLLPILTKLITPAEYAIWSQSIIVTGVLVPIILLKFETSIIKFLPTWNNQKPKENSIILFMMILILILFCLTAVAALLFDEKIANLIFGDFQLSLYVPLIIGLLLSEVLFEFLVALLRISNRIRKVSIYLLIKGIWRIGVIFLVLIGSDGGFYLAFWSFVLFQLFIILLIYIREINLALLIKIGLKKGRPYWAKVLKFSLPLVPFIILMGINNFVDRIFIIHFHGLELLASYAAGFSLAVVVTFFHSTISFMLFPELSRKWANKNKTSIINLMKKVVTAYLALAIPFLVFIAVAGVDVLSVLTTKDYIITSEVLLLITCNITIFGLYQIVYYIVLLERGSLNAPIVMVIVTGINILFNTLLVPKYGMMGAASAGFLSNAFLAIITYNMSQKILKWEFPLTECIRILLRSLVMGLVIWLGIIWLGNSLIALFLILMIAGFIYGLLDFFDNKDSSFFSIINIRKIYRDNIKY